MKAKIIFISLLFLAVSVFLLPAQEQPAAENAGTVYIIREVEFDINGRTKPYYLMINGEFKEGERITGKENLDEYLARKTQLLLNQRVLEEVSIEHSLAAPEADGALPVKLLVHVKDSFNFIILPEPKYSSNDGLSLTLKARDYNFLGTMTPLRIDLGYKRDTDGTNGFTFSLDSDTPFTAAGLDWNINFDHFFEYTSGDPLYYQNVTGLSVKLPASFTTVTLGVNQYLTLNEETSSEDIDLYGSPARLEGFYAASELFASWRIPLGIEVGDFGELAYTPGLSGKINYPYGDMVGSRKPVTTLSHSIGFGRVDLIGNYRKGLTASINNDFKWYFDRGDAPLKITLDAGGAFYWPFSKYFGFSSRLKYRQWWHKADAYPYGNGGWIPYYSAGDMIRGVINDDIRADYMLSLNLDFPIRLLRFWPSEWFDNPKLHFFDFEMHAVPFMDLALIKGPRNALDSYNPIQFSFDDIVATAGLEIIVYPGFFRSFFLRGSIGYNIKRVKDEGFGDRIFGFFPKWDEIEISVVHSY